MRAAAPEGHLRRAARLAPGLVGAWVAVAFVVFQVSGIDRLDEEIGVEVTRLGEVLRFVGLGAVIGALAAWVETGPLPQVGRRVPLWVWLVARTLAYAAVVFVALVTVVLAVAWVERGAPPWAVLGSDALRGSS